MALREFGICGMNRAVFLDRDGILNVDRGYTFRKADLLVPEGVPEALQRLKVNGFHLVVITNQSGIARGKFGLADVDTFHEALQAEIQRRGGPRLDLFRICPHHPDGTVVPFNIECECRKPGTLLISTACDALNIDPSKSFLIGDKWSDVLCGLRVGARPFLVQNPQGLAYDLPDDVSLLRADDPAGRTIRIATSVITGDVEVYSSLSDVVSRILGLSD